MEEKDRDDDLVDRADEDQVDADWATLMLAALPIMLIVALIILVLAIDEPLRPW